MSPAIWIELLHYRADDKLTGEEGLIVLTEFTGLLESICRLVKLGQGRHFFTTSVMGLGWLTWGF